MLKKYVFDVGAVVAENVDEAEERLRAQGHTHYYLLTTVPVDSKVFRCKRCGDVYNTEDLRELREMGEHYNKKPFLCPDCWDEFQRLDSEDQVKYLVEGKYDW